MAAEVAPPVADRRISEGRIPDTIYGTMLTVAEPERLKVPFTFCCPADPLTVPSYKRFGGFRALQYELAGMHVNDRAYCSRFLSVCEADL